MKRLVLFAACKGYENLYRVNPNLVDRICLALRKDPNTPYSEIAINLCGRDAFAGFLTMLAACHIHENRLIPQ